MAAQCDSLAGYLLQAQPLPEPGATDPGSNSERSTDSPLAASEDDSQTLPHSTDPDWLEERFRVDRKKLEAMLQAAAEGKGKSGEDFFQKIMEETNTQIAWPSKLKIGAKSKKAD
ncbi:protein bicaudal C homolog 1-A isoform X2 [Rhincodon typus]|uniref:protein bicaudal C homolog 1-A isoform X2 n=1 Tax=Rhincodon typus TaxID=259920 RepID=UPI0020303420|nr:protein bicaudal C homolog 1-A isoform X2 [Rhincodon typus]